MPRRRQTAALTTASSVLLSVLVRARSPKSTRSISVPSSSPLSLARLPRSLHSASRIAAGASADPRSNELLWSVGRPIRWINGRIGRDGPFTSPESSRGHWDRRKVTLGSHLNPPGKIDDPPPGGQGRVECGTSGKDRRNTPLGERNYIWLETRHPGSSPG